MHLDQARAQRAFQFVQGFKGAQADLLQLARKLPFMLHTNGLLATWAHLLSKKEAANPLVLAILLEHLRADSIVPRVERPNDGADPGPAFEAWVQNQNGLSGRELRLYTMEAIEFAGWLKRAAEALCDTGDNAQEDPS